MSDVCLLFWFQTTFPGLFAELSDQQDRQSQLLSRCCCIAEQISETEVRYMTCYKNMFSLFSV